MAADFPQSPQLEEVFTVGDRAWKWNGYAWDKIAGTGSQPYGVILYFPGTPEPNEILLGHVAAQAAAFPEDLSGSQATVVAAPSVDLDFPILKNRVQVGVLRLLEDQTTGVFLPYPAFTLAPGDILEVVAPAALDDVLSDIYLTLLGSR